VFDRDPTGAIVTLGQVVVADASVREIASLKTESDDTISVQVGDLRPGPDASYREVEYQWRRYAPDRFGYRQVGGPTEFPKRPATTDLAITATDVRLGPLSSGVRHGTTTVTVRNVGPAASPALDLSVNPFFYDRQPVSVEVTTNVANCRSQDRPVGVGKYLDCHIVKALAPGESASFTIQFVSPQANDEVIPTTPNPDLTWGASVQEVSESGATLRETTNDNNSVRMKVSRAG
jgi:hypothetical protein